ncbi:hypothetical protein ATO49_04130 [Mycolicibacterium fortuitum subsp. fortuitum DSM 46621 = ATCC 6841 = JCM 6387]|nr:hypothetical protein ATO49_04130 [Mycolicibacterium fortuitum subsp. fortuitum DSM 46621 = ATCC 6841 = JCM 6387]
MPARISSVAVLGAPIVIGVGVFRCGQGALVQLAVDRQRQRIKNDDGCRHHVGRQPLRQLRADHRGLS